MAQPTARSRNKDSALHMLSAEPQNVQTFYEVAARALVQALGYRWGGVVLLNTDGVSALIVALVDGERALTGTTFPLQGTPCGSLYAGVPQNGYAYFCDTVPSSYPGFDLLGRNAMQTYLGSCFKDPLGTPVGHVFVADDREQIEQDDARAFLALVAQRVGSQWVRQQSENKLQALSQSQEELRQHYEAIMRHSQDFLSFIDKEYRYLAMSKKYCEVFQRPVEALVGLHAEDLFGQAVFRDSIRPHFDRCLQGEVVHVQHLMETQEGARMLDSMLIPCNNDKGEVIGIVTNARDITDAFNLSERLAFQASHDDLTQLINRREFESRLQKCLADSVKEIAHHALCYLDLDQFKVVNDTVGHAAGDQILKQVATLLQSKVRATDSVARLGGDEFGLLLIDCELAEAARNLDHLRALLEQQPFQWEGRTFQITASIGVVPISRQAPNIHQLMSYADIACYTAKDLGRNRVHVYEMQDADLLRRQREMNLAGQIRSALQDDRFVLFHQPVASLTHMSSANAYEEILVRMVGNDGSMILPSAFVPSAERYGLMRHVDEWVVRTVLREYDSLFRDQSFPRVAINLSGTSLTDDSFLRFVRQEIDNTGFNPDRLCFEITETAAINNAVRAGEFITDLRRLGCHFALDDFGSGLSSFSYLKQFPVDYLKIDGSFIRSMETDRVDRALVDAIANVARCIGIRSIAEHLETPGTLAALRQSGIDFAQGYLIQVPKHLPRPGDPPHVIQ